MTAQSPLATNAPAPTRPTAATGDDATAGGRAQAGSAQQTTVCWEGDLDVASGPVLAAAVQVLADLGVRSVVLDVSGVGFLDCGGLGALLAADTRLPDGLLLACPSRPVRWLLSLVGLDDRFATSDLPRPTASVSDTRTAIEVSKGLIMGSYGCTQDQASRILVSTALQRNVQVQVLAALLVTVTSAQLDPSADDPAGAVQRVIGTPGETPLGSGAVAASSRR